MKRDIITFATGLATGLVVGLFVRDKHKKMIQDTIVDYLDNMRKKCEVLTHNGQELVEEGVNKAKETKKEFMNR